MLRPADITQLCEIIAGSGGPFRLRGGGSKDAIGSPTDAAVIDMRGFAGVVDYDPPELVLTVRAGTPLAEIQALVAGEGQMLAFEPFDHAALLGGTPGLATIGGVIASGVAGPARLSRGAARDHLLGFTGVSGRGERFVAGAKVVKNVTGYDLPKLITGSWGRLVAITELTLKVLPAPRARTTLLARGLDPVAAAAAMARAMGSAAEVSAAAHLPAWEGGAVTALRLDGFPASIRARAETLHRLIDGLEPLEDDAPLWDAVRDAAPLPRDKPLWRIIVPGRNAPALIAALPGAEWLFDWAGGLVWLASDADPQAIRIAAANAGGHAMLIRADAAMRAAVPALHPQPAPLAALETKVRRAFDPAGLFETGRF
ncbi:glycolate oxidase subunit GlcE [Sphingomonas kyeonggiensis]|uniref:Glycolate oxidase FAD binding subunit n=1 Tax=Sphingomonas kyeonggiensis TaxID=1268553 RepID=A0A7W6JV74_9SPHN|nr:glycolate oxidase subunit GlcE [Sphingomonas kyeonggiensis]MBB4099107.1 glycolate oxidase FAD binding subunit [Sphingomonas kyeonggiensis]